MDEDPEISDQNEKNTEQKSDENGDESLNDDEETFYLLDLPENIDMIDATDSITDETVPVTDESAPILDENRPIADELVSVNDEAVSVTDENDSITDEAVPITAEDRIEELDESGKVNEEK